MSDYWKDNNIEKPPSRIVCAAMRKDGRIITGARHYDKVMREQMEASEGLVWWRTCEQGFINQFGEFLTREEAWEIANTNGQIIRESTIDGMLFSECLY